MKKKNVESRNTVWRLGFNSLNQMCVYYSGVFYYYFSASNGVCKCRVMSFTCPNYLLFLCLLFLSAVDSSGQLVQSYYMAGFMPYDTNSMDFKYPQFGYEYQYSISRLNSARLSPHGAPLQDIFQQGWDANRLNPHISQYVEFVTRFEVAGSVYHVVRDYGKPVSLHGSQHSS